MNMIGDMERFQKFNTAIAIGNDRSNISSGIQEGMAMGAMISAMQQQTQQQTQQNQPQNSVQDDATAKLQKLKTLFESGLIDETEYKEKKAEILSSL